MYDLCGKSLTKVIINASSQHKKENKYLHTHHNDDDNNNNNHNRTNDDGVSSNNTITNISMGTHDPGPLDDNWMDGG